MSATALERLLERDRVVILGALVLLVVTAWTYLFWFASSMEMPMQPDGMAGMDMPLQTLPGLTILFVMWAVMMVGMMTPSVTPMVLLYARVGHAAGKKGHRFASSAWFFSGYLLAWSGFAALATIAHWLLQSAAGFTAAMSIQSPVLAGGVLIAAGLYQWTPLKEVCLAQCQSPLQFLQRHGGFRSDPAGALRLGMQHGGYCIGCCWTLMALLFVLGVMNLLWIAALSGVVLAEKLAPAGRLLSRIVGAALILAGIGTIVGSF